MRLIDADALMENVQFRLPNDNKNAEIIDGCVKITRRIIENAPTIDAVPVVRCKDCKSFKEYTPEFKESAECVEGADGDCITRVLYSDAHPQFSAVRKCDYCSLGAKMDGGAEDG